MRRPHRDATATINNPAKGCGATPCPSIAANDTVSPHRGTVGHTCFLILLATTFFLITASGCELVAFVTQGFAPRKIKALHDLADRPTLVLVDDPLGRLGDPGLPNEIANQVAFHLAEESLVSQDNLIEARQLYDLRTKLGKDYSRTPVDRIGRELGAQQVIHVYVESVSYSQNPGMYHPTATVHVKVIDAVKGKRLFPLQKALDDENSPLSHHAVNVSMPHRTMADGGHHAVRFLGKPLAQRLGRDIARVFFDHLPRQPGDPLEN